MVFPNSKTNYNHCCNPYKLKNHRKTKSLRKVTEDIKKVLKNISLDQRLCSGCRNRARKEYNDMQYELMLDDSCVANALPSDIINDSVEILNNLKLIFHDLSTSKSKKIKILTILPSTWNHNQIKQYFNVTDHMIKHARSLVQDKGILSSPYLKKGKSTSSEIISSVTNFYLRDDVSWTMPGMKDVMCVKNSDGTKEKLQKRLILLNLKELYKLYKLEFPENEIGFTKFTLLRPKNCVLAGSSGTHSVCVCSYHQNVKLMILDSHLADLTKNEEQKITSYTDCFDFLICESPSDLCYFNTCEKCPPSNNLEEFLLKVFEENDITSISFKQWINNPHTTLETLIKDTSEFVTYFSMKVKELLPHALIASKQSLYSRTLKDNLELNNFQIIVDFAENYAFTIQDAAPGFHWNNNQATIYNVVIYYRDNEITKHRSLVIISDCLIHDAVAVYSFHKIIINFLNDEFSSIKKIYYFSDGAPQQYKNYKNVINLAHHKMEFGCDAEWHFYPTAHGKGPCDGLGATIKRGALRASLQRSTANPILTSEDLFNWLNTTERMPNITFKYSSQENYDENKKFLARRFQNNRRIQHLQRQHCLIPMDGTVRAKLYSEDNVYTDTIIF